MSINQQISDYIYFYPDAMDTKTCNEIIKHYETKTPKQIGEIYGATGPTVANFLKKHKLFIPYKNKHPMTEEHKRKISLNKIKNKKQ